MAKVDSVVFKLFEKSFTVPVYFHPSSNRFVIEVPEDLYQELYCGEGHSGFREFRNENYSELIREVKQKIKEREEISLSDNKEKVIIYKVDMDCGFDYRDTKTNRKKELYLGSTHRGTGIKLKYQVAWKQSFRGEIKWKELDEKSEIYIDEREDKVIEWSEQREHFFQEIEHKLNMLCLQFNQFFNKQKKKEFLAMIDGGTKLLPAPEGKKK